MLFARIGHFFSTVARHGVPLGGLFGRDWHPVTALVVYWIESALLVLGAALLCLLLQRRFSAAALAAAREDNDHEAVAAIQQQRAALASAHIEPGPVLLFHLGSVALFGLFFAAILFVMVSNGRIPGPVPWQEVREGAQAIAIVIAVGLTFDLWMFHRMSVDDVSARVNACLARWALLWLLGFAGTWILLISGRPSYFFGFFAGLKVLFEVWGRLARTFGWKSLKQREEEERRAKQRPGVPLP